MAHGWRLGDAAVETRQLTKHFGAVHALRGLDIAVPTGSICALLGPNGAGKTTTIRILCGLTRPSSGVARIGDQDVVAERAAVAGLLGVVLDPPRFYPYLTATQNLSVIARTMHDGRGPVDASGVLARVGLRDAGSQRVGTYSTGMVRRLGLAAALLGQPRVLILDEPTSGLDPAGAEDFRHMVREIASEGRTILFSTHQLSQVEHLCDYAIIINNGVKVLEGNLARLLEPSGYLLHVADGPRAMGYLQALADVSHVETVSPDVVRLRCGHLENSLKVLSDAGILIRHIEPERTSLESVFFDATREKNTGASVDRGAE